MASEYRPLNDHDPEEQGSEGCSTTTASTGIMHRIRDSINWASSSGPVVISCGAFCCSFVALLVKLIHGAIPAFEQVFITAALCWCMTVAWLISSGVKWRRLVDSNVTLLLVMRGVLGAMVVMLYFSSLQLLSLQEAVTIFFSNPVFAVLMEWSIYRKPVHWQVVLGSLLAISGVVCITHPGIDPTAPSVPSPEAKSHVIGAVLAALSALATAGSFCCVRAIGPSVPRVVINWWYHTITFVTSGAAFLLELLQPKLFKAVVGEWRMPGTNLAGYLVALGFAQFLGQSCLNKGFELFSVSRGSAINVQQVLWSYVWEIFILSGHVRTLAIIGSILIVSGVLLVTVSSENSGDQMGLIKRICSTCTLHTLASDSKGRGVKDKVSIRADSHTLEEGSMRQALLNESKT